MYLDVVAARHFEEALVTLERLVEFVVGDNEDADEAVCLVTSLGEHDELGHVRHGDQLTVQLVG